MTQPSPHARSFTAQDILGGIRSGDLMLYGVDGSDA
jgi:hypothetical protein